MPKVLFVSAHGGIAKGVCLKTMFLGLVFKKPKLCPRYIISYFSRKITEIYMRLFNNLGVKFLYD